MLQYTVKDVRIGVVIRTYEDGDFKWKNHIRPWETKGYLKALESRGYKRAYDLDDAAKELVEARRNLQLAKSKYALAKENRIFGQEDPDLDKLAKELEEKGE